MKNKLQTVEKLFKIGVCLSDLCLLCGSKVESYTHLFFECHFSMRCLLAIKDWLQIKCTTTKLGRINRWIKHIQLSKLRKNVAYVVVAATTYSIWQSRNECFWYQIVVYIIVIKNLQFVIKSRVLAILREKISEIEG